MISLRLKQCFVNATKSSIDSVKSLAAIFHLRFPRWNDEKK